ncbi:MAG: 3-dehydroquinate synthase family protein, partial [Acutalibacteraceae bacterium]
MIIPVNIENKKSDVSYDIILERGALKKAADYIHIGKNKALIVTDSGVPEEYARTVADSFENSFIHVFEKGEESKNFDVFKGICQKLLKESFSRKDCVIAVGGGVCGDMAGFAAATYMRGIDFYNIPTTVLSQVDSSIGGKTAIDLDSIKNIIGAFYQPKAVIIDPDVLKTLPERQIANGLAESIKMGITGDSSLFEIFEKDDYAEHIETIIEKSLLVKRSVVQQDEKETGLRRVLNF